jgi:Flp pilus assembly protein TadD
LNNLAWLYHRTGDERALAYAERAYRAAPESVNVLDTLGWILAQEGDLKRGLTLLREAKVRSSKDPGIRYHLAFALDALDRRDEAREELAEAFRLAEDFDEADQARILSKQISAAPTSSVNTSTQ